MDHATLAAGLAEALGGPIATHAQIERARDHHAFRAEPTVNDIWRARRSECEGLLFLVNRKLADMGCREMRDTEVGRRLVAMGVHYGMGPTDVAYQVVDDLRDGKRF